MDAAQLGRRSPCQRYHGRVGERPAAEPDASEDDARVRGRDVHGNQWQRRLCGVDEIVLSLYARGLTTGDIAAHFAEIYDAQVSKDTISRITDRVIEEMQAWTNRPLERGRLRRRVHRRDHGEGP